MYKNMKEPIGLYSYSPIKELFYTAILKLLMKKESLGVLLKRLMSGPVADLIYKEICHMPTIPHCKKPTIIVGL